MRPRVLQVLEATIGGTRRHLRDLTLGLRKSGWQVDVALAQQRDLSIVNDIALFKEAGVEVKTIPMRRGVAPASDMKSVRMLRYLIRSSRPDVIHAHSSKAGVLARLANRGSGIPLVYTPHCFAFEMESGAVRKRIYRGVERWLAGETEHLIAVSERERRLALALGYGKEQVSVIANGIALPEEMEAGGERSYAAVFIGRFSRQKGSDVAARVLGELGSKYPDKRFAMMGAGAGQEGRLPKVPDNVEIMPFGSEGEVRKLLRSSKVLLHPSRWEGWPYLLLDAMGSGVAICATEVGGVGEMISHEREGWLCRAEDELELVQGVERLLGDGELRERVTTASRERVREFGVEEMIDRVGQILSAVCGRGA